MANTVISDFFETLRHLLGDHDPTVRQYPDEVLAAAVRSCIRLNQVPGFTLASASEITPELSDPNKWAQVAYFTVKSFVASHPDRYSYKTRAIGETFGSWRNFLDDLDRNLYRLKNGRMFSTWGTLYTWLHGMTGLPVNLVMSNMRAGAPFYQVTLNSDGLQVD